MTGDKDRGKETEGQGQRNRDRGKSGDVHGQRDGDKEEGDE